MNRYFFSLLIVLFASAISTQAIGQTHKHMKGNKEASSKVLRHVVLFKFKDEATPEQVKEVEAAFAALPSKINTIIGYEWGNNVSPENLNQGFTHCFLVTFKDAAGRDFYLPHPAHKEFGKILGPHLDKVLVFDFIDQK